ncbi:TRAP transporter small permease [Mesobacillus maritimus]|uniref:TRAP transporter small permease subunit n=1 Tax=Mesobacillus maritimus TaxID=1643336 RepID=UPI00203C7807|nr:TRAP transporter small permease [Mesobacillus maritimus]MCM3587859.1 TRAP transporter small permease [Mesobacillus maritimus]MCM3671788.1 TRAP transporter small permease [Mesobacillus maritimus]
MKLLMKTVDGITAINKWAAYGIAYLMVAMVFIFAAARTLGSPIIGDVELVQFTMVLMIVFSLAYTEKTDSHVAITLIYDKLPAKFQLVLRLVAKILTLLFCFLVCWVFVSKMNYLSTSSLLGIVFYPFRFLLIIGFFAWGLEAFRLFIVELAKVKGKEGASVQVKNENPNHLTVGSE